MSLGIGPRATPVRKWKTTLLVACGLAGGCHGSLRPYCFAYLDHHEARVSVGRGEYDLAQGESRRIPVRLSRKRVRSLGGLGGEYGFHVLVAAGPPGQVAAVRGFWLRPARP